MIWLFESPALVALLGILLIIFMGVCWIMSGRKELLYALVACIALVAGLLVAERMITTEREAIEAKLTEIAADVQSNSVSRVLSHIHSSAPEIKAKAQAELPNYQFIEMRVTGIHLVEVNRAASPRTAVVEFNVVGSGSFKVGGDMVSETTVPRWIKLQMVKDGDGEWRVRDYDHAAPNQMLYQDPNSPQYKMPAK